MAGDTLFPKPPWDFTAGIKSRVFEISATEMNTINPKKKNRMNWMGITVQYTLA